MIKEISRVMQKLLKYVNRTAISLLPVPLLLLLFVNFDLNLNDSEPVMA